MNDNLMGGPMVAEVEVAVPQLTPEEMETALNQRRAMLDAVGAALDRKLSEASQWRLPYEQRMLEADAQFRTGLVHVPEAKENNQRRSESHRRAPDNITRAKTIAIVARRQDMLFTGKNWTLRPSPMATLHPMAAAVLEALRQEGASETMLEAKRQQIARDRAQRMEKIIADRLAESKYDQHGRAVVMDSCKLGTGVLEGPFVRMVKRKTYDHQTRSFQVEYIPTQAVERVDPFCFFPQPCRHIREAEWAFKLHIMSRTEVEQLAQQPGFDADQMSRLLKMQPNMNALKGNCVLVGASGKMDDSALKGRYPVFKYKGPVPRELLELLAASQRDRDIVARMSEQDIPTIFGEVWMSMGITLRVSVDPLEDGACLPFRVINYEKDPDSCFGFAVPHVMAHDQDAAHMAWSAALANAMASAVPIPGMRKESLIDESGVYDLLRPGPWVLKGVDDIRKALSFTTVPSTIGPTLEIYDRAKRNADEHAMLPAAAQGEAVQATPQTASGLAMLMNAGNIVQRYAANEWDDEITLGLIRDMVDYEMLWGKDDAAKGDYDVVPIASSHLLVKDVRLQQSLALLQMANPGNPDVAMRIRTERVIENIVRDMEVPAEEYLRSDEEVQAMREQMQPPPSDTQIKAQVEQYKADLEAQIRLEEAGAKIEAERMRGEFAPMQAEINLRAQAMRVAADEKVALEKVMNDLRIAEIEAANRAERDALRASATERMTAIKEASKRIQIGSQTQLRAAEIAQRTRSEQLQVAVESPPRLQ